MKACIETVFLVMLDPTFMVNASTKYHTDAQVACNLSETPTPCSSALRPGYTPEDHDAGILS